MHEMRKRNHMGVLETAFENGNAELNTSTANIAYWRSMINNLSLFSLAFESNLFMITISSSLLLLAAITILIARAMLTFASFCITDRRG